MLTDMGIVKYELLCLRRAGSDMWSFVKAHVGIEVLVALGTAITGVFSSGWIRGLLFALAGIGAAMVLVFLYYLALAPSKIHSEQSKEIDELRQATQPPRPNRKEIERKLYASAIEILVNLMRDQTVAVYFWRDKYPDWYQGTAKLLVTTAFGTGQWEPVVQPSSFDPIDRLKMKAAKRVIDMYLYASEKDDFEQTRRAYDLPHPDDARNLLRDAES